MSRLIPVIRTVSADQVRVGDGLIARGVVTDVRLDGAYVHLTYTRPACLTSVSTLSCRAATWVRVGR